MKQLNWYQIFGKSNIPDGRTVLPTDDIQIWLHCANIWDKTYTTLAEVLADTDTLLALITSNNAVDYMVRSTTWAARSALVPKMTSNTTPSGVASASSVLNAGTYAYSAFDETDTPWISAGSTYDSNYVQYVFAEGVVPSFVEWTCFVDSNTNRQELNLKGAEDGINYSDVLLNVAESSYADKKKFSYEIPNTKAYRGFRAYSNVNLYGGQWFGAIRELQFYSASIVTSETAMQYIGQNNYCANTLLADATWCEAICNSEYFESVLNVKVPTMTGYTTPDGEVVDNVSDYHYPAWQAFDRQNNTVTNPRANEYVGYIFDEPVKVAKVFLKNYTNANVVATFTIQYSDDKANWVNASNVITNTNQTVSGESNYVIDYPHASHTGWRMFVNSVVNYGNIAELQFYGRRDV